MRELNREWRGFDKPTDVLSFGTTDDTPEPEKSLGDIVISVETALRQAEELGHSFEEEVERLLVHGILHLLGHDHENATDAKNMRVMERKVLKALRKS